VLRILVVASVVIVGVARADAPSPGDSWARTCEAGLRRAARVYGQSAAELERWEWTVDDHGVKLHYYQLHAELDYDVTVEPSAARSHPWRTRSVHNKQFPEVVDERSTTRAKHGRVATFRASGMAGMKERDAFFKVFRPALESCLAGT
jgi:hypothetical protein